VHPEPPPPYAASSRVPPAPFPQNSAETPHPPCTRATAASRHLQSRATTAPVAAALRYHRHRHRRSSPHPGPYSVSPPCPWNAAAAFTISLRRQPPPCGRLAVAVLGEHSSPLPLSPLGRSLPLSPREPKRRHSPATLQPAAAAAAAIPSPRRLPHPVHHSASAINHPGAGFTVHPSHSRLSSPPVARHCHPRRCRAAPPPPKASPCLAVPRHPLRFPKSPPQPPLHRRPEPPPPFADCSRVVPLLWSSPTHAIASLGSARTRRSSATAPRLPNPTGTPPPSHTGEHPLLFLPPAGDSRRRESPLLLLIPQIASPGIADPRPPFLLCRTPHNRRRRPRPWDAAAISPPSVAVPSVRTPSPFSSSPPAVTTGNNPTGVPDVRALILVPGGKVHQKLIQFRV